MTDLFTVSVDSVEGAAFHGRVHLIGADAVRVPRDVTFPVALLVDAWSRRGRGGPAGGGAPDTGDARLDGEFRVLHECLHGRLLRVTDDGFLLADDGTTVLEPRRRAAEVYDLGGADRDEVSAYVRTLTDADAFGRLAASVVTGYDIGPLVNVPVWSDVAAVEPEEWEPGLEEMATWSEPADLDYWRTWRLLETRPFEELPCAGITVKVSDPAYLEPLADGMRWSTAYAGTAG
ncbi:hypothetical protein OG711_22705 [Streptomyces uncialis]|uniref:hypothetical protein n=1 Tax=Streptomyces uncialis TaxID=1048205 RepID=UPI002E364543|nr:hypothetical protein [Streptomyces uncialis]